MTKDLALLVGQDAPFLTTEEFLDALRREPAAAMASWQQAELARRSRT